MAYQMRIDEMLGCLIEANAPKATEMRAKVESVANELAKAMRNHFDVASGRAVLDMDVIMVPFGAKVEGQELPIGMVGYDTISEFGFNDFPNVTMPDLAYVENVDLPGWIVSVQATETYMATIHAATEDEARADAMVIWPESGTEVFESKGYDWEITDIVAVTGDSDDG